MERNDSNMIVFLVLLSFLCSCAADNLHEEIITVTQHTKFRRAKREDTQDDLGNGMINAKDFPNYIEFTLHLKDGDIRLILQKYMTPHDIKTKDENGDILFDPLDPKRQYGAYQDKLSRASVIVKCLDSPSTCTLDRGDPVNRLLYLSIEEYFQDGSFHKDGDKFRLMPVEGDLGQHKIVNASSIFDQKSVRGVDPDGSTLSNGQEFQKAFEEIHAKVARDLYRKASAIEDSEIPSEVASHLITKRQSSSCNIAEIQAVGDFSVWNFFLEREFNESEAEAAIEEHYIALFSDVDLRYKCLEDQNGICFRVYMTDLRIEKTQAESWSNTFTADGKVDAFNGLVQTCPQRIQFAPSTDLTICFTRLYTDFNGDTVGRVFQFTGTLCNPTFSGFRDMIAVDRHDDQAVHIASSLLGTMDVDPDGVAGCNDSLQFIGSQINLVPTIPGTELNPWRFSQCSQDGIQAWLDFLSANNYDCLLTGTVTEEDADARVASRELPGKVFDLDYQCQLAFDVNSSACIGTNETSIFDIEDICVAGVYCTVGNACVNRSRVYTGSPCGCKKQCIKSQCLREFNISLGESCTGECECFDPNSECDADTHVCLCVDGFYDSNGIQPEGVCLELIPTGDNCSVPDSCLDENADCNLTSGICECNEGFFDIGNGTCVAFQILCGECIADIQCVNVNASCVLGECKCLVNQYVDECGICQMKLQLGANCSGEEMCLDERSCCNPVIGECECVEGTYDSNGDMPGGVCLDLIENGNNCTFPGSCEDPNAECNDSTGTCSCVDGYFLFSNDSCLEYKNLCDTCDFDIECVLVGATCVDGLCKCSLDQYTDECGICNTKLPLGANCSGEEMCLDESSCCNPVLGECECVDGTYDSNGDISGGICLKLIENGDNCTITGSCEDSNAECDDTTGTCECVDGYFLFSNDTCLEYKNLCDACNYDVECALVNGSCVEGLCECLSNQYTDECGICNMKLQLGANCSGEEMCLDESSCCNPVLGECECVAGTYDSNGDMSGGVCLKLIENGDNCTLPGSCEDPNAECGNSTGTCTCVDGYFLSSNDTCLEYKNLCDTCDYDVECALVGGTCVDGLCECLSNQYTDECGICNMKLPLGANCSGEEMCLDESSCCNPVLGECECVEGTYDSNGEMPGGVCLELIDNGDNCTLAGSCEDPNAECDNSTGTCTCVDGYFLFSNDTCLEYKNLCDTCDYDVECALVRGTCVEGLCECLSNQYTDECGICNEKLPLGVNCSGEEMCLDESSCCNPVLGECECVEGTYDSNGGMPGGVCLELIENGDNCTLVESCEDPNAECDNSTGTCECVDGYFLFSNDTCLEYKNLCETCDFDVECALVGGTCVDGLCECLSNQYTDECGICDMKLPLGANCSGEEMCLDESSCCNPVLGECVCVEGTYDSNGDMPGGHCLELIDNGDNCTLPGSCEDPNAECDNSTGTCSCVDGYFLFSNDSCLEYKNLCDTCDFDVECALVGGTCVDGLCECLSDQYTDECGICNIKLPLGANCSGEEMCLDESSCCNPVLGECECVEGTYDSNGDEPGGVCLELIENGDNCTLSGSCEDPNAECDDFTGTCTCVDGYFLFSNDSCLEYKNLCDTCDYDVECALVGGTCVDGLCECLSNQYTDECGICNEKLPLGANCSGEEMCLDESSCCNPILEECECVEGTYDSNGDEPGGVCLELIENGDNCTLPGSCEDPNAECDNSTGTCECVNGYFLFSNDSCLEYKNLCETCDYDVECALVGGTCVDGLCECLSNQYTDECGICNEKLPLGANCSGEEMCLDESSCCNPVLGECECVEGTYDSNGDEPGGHCLELIENGDNCTLPGSCEDPNAECDDSTGTCTCVDGYFLFSNDSCLEYKNLCDTCDYDLECALVGGTCVEGLCECLSNQYTDECGICNMKLPLGANCSGEEMCLDENSCCNPVLGACECVEGTYDSNGDMPGGVCLDLTETGDNCTLPGSCKDPHAECDNSTGTCECIDGFFLTVNGTCLNYKNLCDSCDYDEECALVHATCVLGFCACAFDQYTDECGICNEKLPLGANCSGEEMCLDESSCCNPVLGECQCVDGTFDSNGDMPGGVCLELIENGDNCTLPGSCEDPHAECNNSTGSCECVDVFFFATNGSCLPYKNLCDSCDFDEECVLVSATCVLGFCECASYQYTDECGICNEKLPLGANCSGEEMCLDERSCCNPVLGECECVDGTYDSNGDMPGGECLDLIKTGDNCTLTGSCEDPHAECDDSTGTCECVDGFFFSRNGSCLAYKNLCDSCEFDEECLLVRATCIHGFCECASYQYTDECGICNNKLPLGANCSGEEMCQDEKSCCNPILGECECADGSYDSNGDMPGGVCLDPIEIGENCTLPGSCEDPHAECDDSTGTCECIDGFFSATNGSCLAYKDLCDSCDYDEECALVHATCVLGYCECALDQYTDECGICNKKLPLGANCSGEEMCLDERSCCNPVLGGCECVEGTYDSNGDMPGGECLDLIETGDNCTLPGSCEDPHAECDEYSDTCECVDGFFLATNGSCSAYKNLCDVCDYDEECFLVHATCVLGFCECAFDQYTDECGVCRLKLPLGDECSGEEMCLDERSCCNPVLGECECVEGTYDSNGDMSGGVCLDLVETGDNCTLLGSCEDPHAECDDYSDTCECVDGFFYATNGSCLAYKDLCDSCDFDEECALVRATCVLGYCECALDQYTDECGICNKKLPLGANCTGEEMCLDERSCCNPVLGGCECVDGTYDSNGDMPGGVCLDPIETGDNCTLPGSCEDPHAECDDYSGTCECIDGFFFATNGSCLAYKNLCDSCDYDEECALVHATCVLGFCECASYQYTDECGICNKKLPLGANCSGEEMCLDERSCCNPVLGECECVDGTYDSNGDEPGGVCLDLIETGDNCTLPGSCEDPHAECDDYSDTCECINGFFFSANGSCLAYKDLCDSCDYDEECFLVRATCVLGYCECALDQYTDECGICNTKLPLGANCSGEEMCLDERSCCNPILGECECVEGTYDSNGDEPGGVCLDLIETGDNCTLSGSCEDPHAECNDYSGTCECVDGFFLATNGSCSAYKNLCDSCDYDEECELVHATCILGYCECALDQYTDECGICNQKLPLGANCSDEQMCLDERSCCNPVLGGCECVEGTYDSNGDEPGGVCLDLIETGDNCTLPGSCEDPYAECDDYSGTCECIDGFFVATNGTCLEYKNLCDSCDFDEECALVHATCVLGYCECDLDQYTDECGICNSKLPLGANCSGEEMCLDERSCCNPVLGECECVEGTYDSNGDEPGGLCLDLIETGDNCTFSGSCEDPHAKCDDSTGTCECIDGFFLAANGTCLEYKDLCDTCDFDEECAVVQATCVLGFCECALYQYTDECGICNKKLPLGANCSGEEMCLDERSCCNPVLGGCECVEGTYDSNGDEPGGVCLDLIPTGGNCSIEGSCEDCNAECNLDSYSCECIEGYFESDNGTCFEYRFLSETCVFDTECALIQGFCDEGICKCNDWDYADQYGICRPRILLGANCSEDSFCADQYAFCNPFSSICECVPPSFESVSGQCQLPTIPNGDGCIEPYSCEDQNAVCDNTSRTCECDEGFFLLPGNNTCLPYKALCEDCTIDLECEQVNATCIMGRCECSDIQYTSVCGICEMSLALGENCTADTKCLDENAFCDPIDGVCECAPGTFASVATGLCEDPIPVGGNCSQVGSCADPHAECDLDSGTCECIDRFFELPGRDTCLPFKDLCEPCTVQLECDYVNATCMTGQCLCTSSQYVSRCGICEMRLALGENCTDDAECLDDNAYCDSNDGVCVCQPGTFASESTGMCEDAIPNGGGCSQLGSCADPNAECVYNSACECVDGFFLLPGNNTCLPYKDLCDSCSLQLECDYVNATCMMGQCLCTSSQYVSRCGICEMRLALGENCTEDTECLDDNAYCDSNGGVCVCQPGTFASESTGMCEDAIPNGGSCSQAGSCADLNAECNLYSTKCECTDGFFLLPGNNTCLPYKDLCDTCSLQEECDYVNATCMMGQCLCTSSQYVSRCGICEMRLALGENCTDDTECLDDNAYCDSNDGVCVCEPGTFASTSTGMCENEIANGGSCSQLGSCADVNAECDLTSCQCLDGFFLLAGNNTCLPYKNLCEDCSISQECDDVNATCVNNICQCGSDQYVSRCGVCQMKLALGANCSTDTECLDDNAACDPDTSTCCCLPGTYEDNGVCVNMPDLGENCTSTNQCLDCNAICQSFVCVCGTGFFEDAGICVATTMMGSGIILSPRQLGDSCNTDCDCTGPNVICDNSVCTCSAETVLNSAGDACEVPNGLVCVGNITTSNCLDPNAACLTDETLCDSFCVCKDGYYLPKHEPQCTGTCQLQPIEGAPCTPTANPCDDICFNSTCREDTCAGDVALGDICQFRYSCAEYPNVKCVSYADLGATPPEGRSSSDTICVCNDDEGYYQVDEFCFNN